MITPAEFSALVDELLVMGQELERLGKVEVMTSRGAFSMFEQALSRSVPEQKAYSDLKGQYLAKKRIVDAHDMVARYELFYQQPATVKASVVACPVCHGHGTVLAHGHYRCEEECVRCNGKGKVNQVLVPVV